MCNDSKLHLSKPTVCSEYCLEILKLFCSHSFPLPPPHLCQAEEQYGFWFVEREMLSDFPESYKKAVSELETQVLAFQISALGEENAY